MNTLIESLDAASLLATAQAFGLRLVLALLTFFIGRLVARLLIAALRRSLHRAQVDTTLAGFVGNVAYGLLLAVIVVAALGQLGVSTTSAAALLGGAGIAVGLSLKDQLSSFAAGILLITLRPFKQGDYIEAGGVKGVVEGIRLIATVLRTTDNQEITVPNATVWGTVIINFNARDTRRIDQPIGISYEADIARAKTLVQSICAADERVLDEPAAWIGVTDLADSAVILRLRAWVNTGDYWQTRSDLLEAIKARFDAEGVGIPYPQMDVHLHREGSS